MSWSGHRAVRVRRDAAALLAPSPASSLRIASKRRRTTLAAPRPHGWEVKARRCWVAVNRFQVLGGMLCPLPLFLSGEGMGEDGARACAVQGVQPSVQRGDEPRTLPGRAGAGRAGCAGDRRAQAQAHGRVRAGARARGRIYPLHTLDTLHAPTAARVRGFDGGALAAAHPARSSISVTSKDTDYPPIAHRITRMGTRQGGPNAGAHAHASSAGRY